MLNYREKQSDTEGQSSASVATILSAKTQVPLDCDNCGEDQLHSIEFLRQLPQLNCQHCQDERYFSQLELDVLESALKELGFYLSR